MLSVSRNQKRLNSTSIACLNAEQTIPAYNPREFDVAKVSHTLLSNANVGSTFGVIDDLGPKTRGASHLIHLTGQVSQHGS